MDKKTKFYQVYGNLPLGLRQEIVVIVDGEPLSWNAAKIEIDNNTDKTEEILDNLDRLELLK